MEKLVTIVGLIVALSVASERLVDIVKGVIRPLNEVFQDRYKESLRRAAIQGLAVVAGIATSLLARPVIAEVVPLPQPELLWLVALGLLASGGSSFWNAVLAYVLSVKELKAQDAAGKRSPTA